MTLGAIDTLIAIRSGNSSQGYATRPCLQRERHDIAFLHAQHERVELSCSIAIPVHRRPRARLQNALQDSLVVRHIRQVADIVKSNDRQAELKGNCFVFTGAPRTCKPNLRRILGRHRPVPPL